MVWLILNVLLLAMIIGYLEDHIKNPNCGLKIIIVDIVELFLRIFLVGIAFFGTIGILGPQSEVVVSLLKKTAIFIFIAYTTVIILSERKEAIKNK